MKIIQKSGPLLCDAEIFDNIKTSKERSPSIQNLQTICVEIESYLKERPAGNPENPQSFDNIGEFMKALKQNNINLEKGEVLQIVNCAPDNWPVLYCLIEEADIRFSEEQLESILELSQNYLGYERVPQ